MTDPDNKDGRVEVLIFYGAILFALLWCLFLFSSCATGPVKTVRFEKTIDQTKNFAGCATWTPNNGEVTLITPETCVLIMPDHKVPGRSSK